MTTGSLPLHVDSAVAPLVLSIIESAKQEVTIVSPYLKLWPHAKQALERAARKKVVRLRLVIRKNRDDKDKDKDDLSWLSALGVEVLEVENLHAKIYINETSAILSSMNFHASSAQGSLEVAVPITDPVTLSQLREYITETLIPSAKSSGKTSFIKSFDKMIREQVSRPYAAKSGGSCIRCRRPIKFEPDKPLCDEDYTSWAEWENPDYEEKFCHSWGKDADVSYRKPLCPACYAKVSRR